MKENGAELIHETVIGYEWRHLLTTSWSQSAMRRLEHECSLPPDLSLHDGPIVWAW